MTGLTIERWLRATDRERVALSESLVRELPSGFAPAGLRVHELGGVSFPVASFAWRGATFSLVPGGRAELGWGPDRPWRPDPDELASFADSAEEYGIDVALTEFVAAVTSPRRAVEIAPLLVETVAREVGWAPADPADAEVGEAMKQLEGRPGPYSVEIVDRDATLRVRKEADGRVVAERSMPNTHAAVVGQLARDGLRLPTSDEWEHLCGGGARTLFRWGDHAPCDRYPTDVSPAEAAWRRAWALSGGELERPPEGFADDWGLHRRPNAFGLQIAFDPYKYELVAEPDRTRGGDGGSTICGGAGFFLGWLTLATAYFDGHSCRRDPAAPIAAGYTVARRVLALA